MSSNIVFVSSPNNHCISDDATTIIDNKILSQNVSLPTHSNTKSACNCDNKTMDNFESTSTPKLNETDNPNEIVTNFINMRRASKLIEFGKRVKDLFIEKKIKEDGFPVEILNGLYLGSIGAAYNKDFLLTTGITHILCVADEIDASFPNEFVYKFIKINDASNVNIECYFDECYEFIENALYDHKNNRNADENITNKERNDNNHDLNDNGCVQSASSTTNNNEANTADTNYCKINDGINENKLNGKILVHCFAGASRSITVVAAYLMKKCKLSAIDALKMVKSKRAQANPNPGFIIQLIKYQSKLSIPLKSHAKTQRRFKEKTDSTNLNDGELTIDSDANNQREDSYYSHSQSQSTISDIDLNNLTNHDNCNNNENNTINDGLSTNETNDNYNITPRFESKAASGLNQNDIINNSNDNEINNANDNGNHDANLNKSRKHKKINLGHIGKIESLSPIITSWDQNGKRRPSLFTAIEKLKALKNASQSNSSHARSNSAASRSSINNDDPNDNNDNNDNNDKNNKNSELSDNIHNDNEN